MQLTSLFKNIVPAISDDISVQNLSCDSRFVQQGDLFVAVTCDKVLDHILSACQKGVAAIVIEDDVLVQNKSRLPQALYIPVPNARQTLSDLARQFYPGQPHQIAAVTGTNGKSSVATFVRQLWEGLGLKAASFGTLGLEITDPLLQQLPVPKLTTPDAISLHCLMDHLKTAHVEHFVFEASSHGLDQYRLHGANVKVAGFTNLTQDHLDYHQTMEAYFNAKSKLFTQVLDGNGLAVLNADSPYTTSLKLLVESRGGKVLTYGIHNPADLMATSITLHKQGVEFDLVTSSQTWQHIRIPVVSNFQIENILCAVGMVMAENIPLEKIVPILLQLSSAKGRMQLAGATRQGAAIYVDYAHTPDALIRALQALRSHLTDQGQLHVVFGCGGNRDTGKRGIMGEAAQTYADVVYITDDNPRQEDPSFIRAQVLAACPKGQEIADRYVAIEKAISKLQKDDVLLIAGKGHEEGQIILNDIFPFCDVQVVQEILARKTYGFMDSNRT